MYNFLPFKQEIKDVEEWLKNELSSVRTGRATPTLLDGVKIEAWGSKMPLNQAANIGTEDPRTLRVVPFDISLTKEIEKAISAADLGVGTVSDGKSVRVTFPMLTSERREQLIRLAKQKMEEARVSLKGYREHVWTDIQKQEKEALISEDVKFKAKEDMQKLVDECNKALEELYKKKEVEITTQ
jgi:ribosome recycling factor